MNVDFIDLINDDLQAQHQPQTFAEIAERLNADICLVALVLGFLWANGKVIFNEGSQSFSAIRD